MAEDMFRFGDELGPLRIAHVYEPSVALKGVLVVDNVASGPSIGGLRVAPDVSAEECFRLARAMTLKNAAAELPHGGGKSVLFADPRASRARLQDLVRAFACALRGARDYIFGPDMGTDEECMAWVKDEIGRAVGLPRALGGIPLDEIGATGWGLAHATDVALQHCDFGLEGARVAVQGFGAVGRNAARFLVERGALLVAASDSRGAVHDPNGLDVSALIELKAAGKSVAELAGRESMDRDAIIDVECDIWIPAARPDVINQSNARRLRARLVMQGANVPVTPEAERHLHERGVLCVPDFIANAGGVICAAMEYRGASEMQALQTIEEKLRRNTRRVLEAAREAGVPPREAALRLALERVSTAMGTRRWSLF